MRDQFVARGVFGASAAIDVVRAVDIEIESLVKLLGSEVASEFEAVISHHFSKAVRNLISVSALRELTFKVVANRKAAGNVYIRHAFAVGAEVRMNAKVGIARVRKTIGSGNRFAGILHQRSVLRMQERTLSFAEECEPCFVHGRGTNGPGMADVYLLRSLVGQVAKAR